MSGERTPDTIYQPASCLAYDCHEEVSAIIYNRLAGQFRSVLEPLAVVRSCDQHIRVIMQYCHADEGDVTYLPNHCPF